MNHTENRYAWLLVAVTALLTGVGAGRLIYDLTGDYLISFANSTLAGVVNMAIVGALLYRSNRDRVRIAAARPVPATWEIFTSTRRPGTGLPRFPLSRERLPSPLWEGLRGRTDWVRGGGVHYLPHTVVLCHSGTLNGERITQRSCVARQQPD